MRMGLISIHLLYNQTSSVVCRINAKETSLRVSQSKEFNGSIHGMIVNHIFHDVYEQIPVML